MIRYNSKTRSQTAVECQKFVGDPGLGMTSIARALARKCANVQNPVWISHVRWDPDVKKVHGEVSFSCRPQLLSWFFKPLLLMEILLLL